MPYAMSKCVFEFAFDAPRSFFFFLHSPFFFSFLVSVSICVRQKIQFKNLQHLYRCQTKCFFPNVCFKTFARIILSFEYGFFRLNRFRKYYTHIKTPLRFNHYTISDWHIFVSHTILVGMRTILLPYNCNSVFVAFDWMLNILPYIKINWNSALFSTWILCIIKMLSEDFFRCHDDCECLWFRSIFNILWTNSQCHTTF